MRRLIFWLRRNAKKHCRGCCVVCRYYEVCREENKLFAILPGRRTARLSFCPFFGKIEGDTNMEV